VLESTGLVISIPFLVHQGTNVFTDVYRAADAHGVIVVGGSSYSVGAAGGWVLGGGHSSLSPQYGLGVDSTLFLGIYNLLNLN
jgi:hypothetical protein